MRRLLPAGDLVELVEEDDAALFDALDGLACDVLLVNEFVRFLLNDHLAPFAGAPLFSLWFAAEPSLHHVLDVDTHFLAALRREDLEGRIALLLDVELDFALFEFSSVEPPAELLARLPRRLLGRAGSADERRAGG